MEHKRKTFVEAAMIISLIFALCGLGIAAEFPAKSINMIIPYPPAGTTDLAGRAMADLAEKYMKNPIVVTNKSGGGGTVGVSLVLKERPDGYTIGILGSVSVNTSYHMGKIDFHPVNDVTYIMRYSGTLYGIVVRADSPWKSLKEFVQYCQANPGKVSYATPGAGSLGHLGMEELAFRSGGIKWMHIPTKGGSEWIASLLGGHVDAVCASSAWAPLVDAGKFRALVTFGESRCERYPQIPNLKELGYDMVYSNSVYLFGPKGLPGPIVNKFHEFFKKAVEDPKFSTILKKVDMQVLYLNPQDSKKFVEDELERLGMITEKLGMKKKK